MAALTLRGWLARRYSVNYYSENPSYDCLAVDPAMTSIWGRWVDGVTPREPFSIAVNIGHVIRILAASKASRYPEANLNEAAAKQGLTFDLLDLPNKNVAAAAHPHHRWDSKRWTGA